MFARFPMFTTFSSFYLQVVGKPNHYVVMELFMLPGGDPKTYSKISFTRIARLATFTTLSSF